MRVKKGHSEAMLGIYSQLNEAQNPSIPLTAQKVSILRAFVLIEDDFGSFKWSIRQAHQVDRHPWYSLS